LLKQLSPPRRIEFRRQAQQLGRADRLGGVPARSRSQRPNRLESDRLTLRE
jgi:hypothetical protein